jgi:molybdopterin-guanine dinucleotide biosynthesis protein A
MHVTAAVLAGGQSRRMGRDKAFLPFGGRPLIERTLETLDRRFDEVLVVANDLPRYAYLGRRVAADLKPGTGSLGGIYTAIALGTDQAHSHVFVCACDMPFLDDALIGLLLREAAVEVGGGLPDVVVPEDPDAPDASAGLHPLCAVYGRGTLPAIEHRLAAGRLKVIGFYEDVRVRRVGAEAFARAGVPRHALMNANTPEDLAVAEIILARTASPAR